jgi:hypothetical protein
MVVKRGGIVVIRWLELWSKRGVNYRTAFRGLFLRVDDGDALGKKMGHLSRRWPIFTVLSNLVLSGQSKEFARRYCTVIPWTKHYRCGTSSGASQWDLYGIAWKDAKNPHEMVRFFLICDLLVF